MVYRTKLFAAVFVVLCFQQPCYAAWKDCAGIVAWFLGVRGKIVSAGVQVPSRKDVESRTPKTLLFQLPSKGEQREIQLKYQASQLTMWNVASILHYLSQPWVLYPFEASIFETRSRAFALLEIYDELHGTCYALTSNLAVLSGSPRCSDEGHFIRVEIERIATSAIHAQSRAPESLKLFWTYLNVSSLRDGFIRSPSACHIIDGILELAMFLDPKNRPNPDDIMALVNDYLRSQELGTGASNSAQTQLVVEAVQKYFIQIGDPSYLAKLRLPSGA